MKIRNVYQYKVSYTPVNEPVGKVTTSNIAAEMLLKQWENINDVESFYIITLNRANSITGINLISIGGMSGTTADGKVIFRNALLNNAQAIILAHNHPSGQNKPSESDIELTKKMAEFGKLIDCPVLDHIILMPNSTYYSFADEGKL